MRVSSSSSSQPQAAAAAAAGVSSSSRLVLVAVRNNKKKKTGAERVGTTARHESCRSFSSRRSRADMLWLAAISLIAIQLMGLITTSAIMATTSKTTAATATETTTTSTTVSSFSSPSSPASYFAMAATTTTVASSSSHVLLDDDGDLDLDDFAILSDLSGAASDSSSNSNGVRLGVTIRNKDILNKAPSCLHSISRVELLNQHNEDIKIHSISVAQEETYQVMSMDDARVQRAFGGSGSSSSSNNNNNAAVMNKIHLLVDDWLPQQLHVQLLLNSNSNAAATAAAADNSNLNNEQQQQQQPALDADTPPQHLVLGPGQVAIVPLTFLPRFPPNPHTNSHERRRRQAEAKATKDNNSAEMTDSALSRSIASWKLFTSSNNADGGTNDESSSSSSPVLSIWQMADREEWIGSVSLRSNRVPTTSSSSNSRAATAESRLDEHYNDDLHVDEFYISTTLLVHTDQGVVQLPIQASSLRENPFGLPDVIYFNVSSTISVGTTATTTTTTTGSTTTATTPQHHHHQEHVTFQSSTPTAVPSFSSGSGSDAALFVSENGIRIMDRFWHHPLQQQHSSSSRRSSSSESPPRSKGDRHKSDNVLASSDCFDLYLKHPQSSHYLGMEDMRVFEVLISQPDVTFLQVLPEKDPFVPLVKSPPSQAIRQWTSTPIEPPDALTLKYDEYDEVDNDNNTLTNDERLDHEEDMRRRQRRQRRDARRDGSLYIPADNRQHYLVTICTSTTGVELDRKAERYLASKAQWIDPGDEETSLGYVQIRTDKETLFVALEREVDLPRTSSEASATTTPKTFTAKIDLNGSKTITTSSSSSTFRIGSSTDTEKEKQEQNSTTDDLGELCVNGTMTTSGEPCSSTGDSEEQDQNQRHVENLKPVLQTFPEALEMYLLTSSSDHPVTKTSGNISITNIGTENVTLMESSIAFHELEASKIEKYGLQVKIVSPHNGCNVIPAFSPPCHDAFSIQVTVNWEQINELGVTSFEINGKVIVQGSMKYSTVTEWMYAVSTLDLTADAQVVVEVPLTILLVDGNIGLSVQGTSHPIPFFWHVEKPARTDPENQNVQLQGATTSATKDASSSSTLGRVSAAFFPCSSSDVRALLQQYDGEYEGLYEMKSMDHRLRAYSSSMDIPQLMIDTVEVIPVPTVDTFTVSYESNRTTATTTKAAKAPSSPEDDESLCSRFKVSVAHNASSNTSESSSSTEDKRSNVADLGLVYLRYMFPPTNLRGKEEPPRSSKAVAIFPTECSLRMTTTPPTGVHTTSLFVYPGQVDVSANEFASGEADDHTATPPSAAFEEEDKAIWHRSIVGFDNILHWFQTSKGGSALRSMLEAGNNRNAGERDRILLARYLYGLSRHALDMESSKLRPVLLKVGAIAPNEKEVLPLFITNHNPVPLKITIDVGEVEGMSIALGRDPVVEGESLLDNIPLNHQTGQQHHQRKQRSASSRGKRGGSNGKRKGWPVEPRVPSGPRAGHPLNGLRRFLLTSDIATSFFSRFKYRDGVWMSEGVADSNNMLKRLFAAHTYAQYHTTESPLRFTNSTTNLCGVSVEHPPPYGAFKKSLSGRHMPGPVLLSTDSESVSELAVCWDKAFAQKANESESFETVLPPGGVARFDITLRSPPTSVLERDITQFLASGLVLSTSHGEVMPILILFDAPQGKLDISPFLGYYGSETNSHNGIRAIRVPAGLFREPSPEVTTTLSIPPRLSRTLDDITGVDIMPYSASIAENGVSLFMRSSFNRDIQLLKVTSCNPWFEVVLRNQTSPLVDPLLGVNIGTVSSIVSCVEPNKNMSASLYPSFYRCAMNWVTERADLQPQGCGARAIIDAQLADVDGRDGYERSDYDSAAKALNRALHVCAWSLGNASRSSSRSSTQLALPTRRKYDGVLAPVVVDVVANVWNVWRLSAESSLRRLSTNLRAVIKYNTTEEGTNRRQNSPEAQDAESQFLSVAMKDLLVESVLETPQLLDTDRVKTTLQREDEKLPVVDFPRTYVATVSSMTIPLKNPTAVPVRVRLAALPEEDEELNSASYDLESEMGADAIARKRFLKGLTAPYVQNGRRAQTNPEIVRQQWWDGSGSFFLSDFSGGLIRSHYNITVRAGSGALVSLLNPSLLTNNGFLAGCGSRCGVRDDIIKNDVFYDLRRTSPIGASSATGTTLMGRNRASSAEGNRLLANTMNLKVFAGGSMLSGGFGPSPFAIPFPALGEIIIPPFGTAEVGPIYFRPPGRHSSLGCESVDNTITPEHCAESEFLGLVFLENSLTGLERIALRGRTAWERVVFLDRPRAGDGDEFSDMELRNGRSALIFPGSLDSSNDGSGIVKEVVVKNEGDTTVMFGEAYLSDTNARHGENAPGHHGPSSCTFGDFVLLNCSKSSEGDFTPLRLLPGQSGSLLIEHRPRCAQLTDFVALNLEYVRENDYNPPPGVDRTQRMQNAANSWRKSFRKEKEVLLVGYEMTKWELSICTPWQSSKQRRWAKAGSPMPFKQSYMYIKHHDTKESRNGVFGMLAIFAAVGLFGGASFLVTNYFQLRLHSAIAFRNKLRGLRKNKQQPRRSDTNWRAAFRLIARRDPTSADLQNLCREQIRTVVLSRFRSMGIMATQCFNSAGAMQRERSISLGHAGRSVNGKENGTSGNEKTRTLSDAIFRRFRTKATGSGEGVLPCELGWRTAAARGIVDEASMEKSPIQLKTKALLLRRSEHSSSTGEDSIVTEVEMPSIAGESGSRASSYEGDSADDDSDDSDESSFAKPFQNRKNGHGSALPGSTPLMRLRTSEVHSPPDNSHYTKVAPRSTKGGRKSHSDRNSRKAVAAVGKHATDLATPDIATVAGNSVSSREIPQSPNSRANRKANQNPFDSTVSRPVEEKGPTAIEKTWTDMNESHQEQMRSSTGAPSFLAEGKSYLGSSLVSASQPLSRPLRPPPGLAPPPGFDRSPLPAAMLAPGSPTVLPKDLFAFPPLTGQSQTVPPGLGHTSTIHGDQLLLSSPISPMPIRSGILPADHAPLLDLVLGESTGAHQRQNSFDVMDFLDGILNEGNKAADNDVGPSDLLAETTGSAADDDVGLDGTSLVPIPSNPWAAGAAPRDTSSRASAYGISFEDEAGNVVVENSVLVGDDLPLLTPAAILAHAIAEDGAAEEGADKEYWGTSFYADLLKEQ